MSARRTRSFDGIQAASIKIITIKKYDNVATGFTVLCTLGFIIACAVLTVRGVNHKGWRTQLAFEAWFDNHTCKTVGGSCDLMRDGYEGGGCLLLDGKSQCSGNSRCRCC